MRLMLSFFFLSFFGLPSFPQSNQFRTVDVCVYGGTSAGVIAAYTLAKQGKMVLLVEPGKHLGGLTSGGLGYTDIGNKYVVTGLARDFYRRIGSHYGKFEQWVFEPHVAENIFKDYIRKAQVDVLYNHRIVSASKNGTVLHQITLEQSDSPDAFKDITIKAKVFLDCSYEGDLMAMSGVSYTVGREGNAQYKETYNGVQLLDKHQFPDLIDPYVIAGKPESGLVWGISPMPMDAQGSGDHKVQAYNYRLCLTDNPENRIPIVRPNNYDSSRYELLLRFLERKPAKNLGQFLKIDLMPNQKTDINNNGPFSTDMIGMNYAYPEADYATRKKILKMHEDYTKGLLYFIGHDQRMPLHLRNEMLKWGYPKDEYTDNQHWSFQPYIREARRMVGELVMTQHHCQGREKVEDGVGMAAYTMDSHNIQRIVVNGMVKNEGDVQIGGFPPYPISYRSITPKASECTNLLVPVCLSATHIAFGSIRMEPVFMVLGQSAAMAATMAIDQSIPVQQVNVAALQLKLKDNPLADNSIAEILVDNESTGVSMEGKWEFKKNSWGCYGPSLYASDTSDVSVKRIRFVPEVKSPSTYHVYAYFPRIMGGAEQINVIVFNGKKKASLTIKPHEQSVLGQTRGEWVSLGDHYLDKGKKSYVEYSNQGINGIIIGDALLFVPVKK